MPNLVRTRPVDFIIQRRAVPLVLLATLLALGGCGGSSEEADPAAPTAPAITAQPQSVQVTDGQMASFNVTASGTAPLAYQWRRGGTNIAGATGASYNFTAAMGDSGATFSVVVSNAAGTTTSGNATLTVVASYSIIANVSGLTGTGLALRNNGAGSLPVSTNGAFTIASGVPTGTAYNVVVLSQPTGQQCLVSNGSGTVGTSDATGILVNCTALSGAGAWQTPTTIETLGNDASQPRIAVDSSGNALVVWTQQLDGANRHVWANRHTTAGWQTPVMINADPVGNTSTGSPQVFFHDGGNGLAVWTQTDAGVAAIWENRYAPGAGWGMADKIVETNGAPQIAVQANGNAMMVWSRTFNTSADIWASRYTPAGGWSMPVLIETNSDGRADEPRVAIDLAGNAIAVWQQSDGAKFHIWTNRYSAGSGWGTAARLDTDDGQAGEPQVAMDYLGNAIAVWDQQIGLVSSIRTARYTPALGWSPAASIEATGGGDTRQPHIAFDSIGMAMAVWAQAKFPSNNYRIVARRHDPSTGWSTPVALDDNSDQSSNPRVAFDGYGNALVVWEQSATPAKPNIVANRYDNSSSSWGTPGAIDSDDGFVSAPQVVAAPDGNAIAVWAQEDNDVDYSIWVSRFLR
jgi:hypothetical protein